MLYKDGVRVHLSDSSSSDSRKPRAILDELKKLANSKGIVRFKLLPGMKNPGLFLPLQANVKTPQGAYQMIYATSVQQRGDQIVYSPTTLRWPASGSVDLNRDPELAIFLYGYSTLCYNGKNPNKSNVSWFMVEDVLKEAETKITSKRLIGKVTNLVLETIDDGGAPIQLITNYAKSKGMRFQGEENETIVRSKVLDLITSMELYEEFLGSLTSRKYFAHSELIDEAVELGVLQIMRMANNDSDKAWRFISIEGVPEDIICKVPIRGNARAYLLDELDQNPYLGDDMRERIESSKDDGAAPRGRGLHFNAKDYPVQPVADREVRSTPVMSSGDADALLNSLFEKTNEEDEISLQGPGDNEGSPPSGPPMPDPKEDAVQRATRMARGPGKGKGKTTQKRKTTKK